MNADTKKYRFDRRGVSLVELVMAVAVAGILVTAVVAAWRFVTTHAAREQHRVLFQTETERIGTAFAEALRRGAGVMEWGTDRIVFIGGRGDTLTYEAYGGRLLRNGTAVPSADRRLRVTTFSAFEESTVFTGEEQRILLKLSIDFESAGARRRRLEYEITTPRLDPFVAEGGGWEF